MSVNSTGDVAKICSVSGCERKYRCSGYCNMHYKRNLRIGNPGPAAALKNQVKQKCSFDGCERLSDARTLCKSHYIQKYRRGGELKPILDEYSGDNNPNWVGDNASYHAVHSRLRSIRGSASLQKCIECGLKARQWAYKGGDPNQKFGRSSHQFWSFYSVDLDYYEPMCVKCHRSQDAAKLAEELREYRQWRHETGLTLKDLKID